MRKRFRGRIPLGDSLWYRGAPIVHDGFPRGYLQHLSVSKCWHFRLQCFAYVVRLMSAQR